MADMLVKLYEIECFDIELEKELLKEGIRIKKAIAPDRSRVMEFAKIYGGSNWADEVAAAFSNHPVTCYIATKDKQIIGFACYEATLKAFFGPTAVKEEFRKKGIGKALLLRSLFSLKEMGYGYGFIGMPSKEAIPFYQKTINGVVVGENSSTIYTSMIDIDE